MSQSRTDVLSVSRSTLHDIHAALAKRLSILRAQHVPGVSGDLGFLDNPEYAATSIAFSSVSTAIDALNMARTAQTYRPQLINV